VPHLEDAAGVAIPAIEPVRCQTACPQSKEAMPIDFSQMDIKLNAVSWRHVIVRTVAWGFGCGLAISLAVLFVFFYTQRPRGWNSHALIFKSAKAEGIGQTRPENGVLTVTAIGTTFTVDLENTTGTDITLPQTLRIMGATKGTGALHESALKLPKEYFIPAHHVVTISLDAAELCTADTKTQECFDSNFKDDGEIIIFDEVPKLEIHIPIPVFTSEKDGLPRFIN
jgi:hypothetical protein